MKTLAFVAVASACIFSNAAALMPLAPGFHHDIDSTTITTGARHACVLEYVEGQEVGADATCWGMCKRGQCDPPEVGLNDAGRMLSFCHRTSCSFSSVLESFIRVELQ